MLGQSSSRSRQGFLTKLFGKARFLSLQTKHAGNKFSESPLYSYKVSLIGIVLLFGLLVLVVFDTDVNRATQDNGPSDRISRVYSSSGKAILTDAPVRVIIHKAEPESTKRPYKPAAMIEDTTFTRPTKAASQAIGSQSSKPKSVAVQPKITADAPADVPMWALHAAVAMPFFGDEGDRATQQVSGSGA